MWLGKDINNRETPLDIKWVKEVHSLGIFFSYDTDSVIQKNFMDRAKEFKQILDMWRQRDLSLIGKITILKSLAFSIIIYQCGVLTPTLKFIDHIIDLVYKFIWNDKPEKIKRKTLIADYEHGGLKMLDIKSFIKAQKVMWVKRFLSPENASWKAIIHLGLEDLLGADTFKCSLSCTEKPDDLPDFYWDMILAWSEMKSITESIDTPIDIRRQCLWLNENITISNNHINWDSWKDKGINIIHDIVNKAGHFLTTQEIEQKYNFKCDFLQYNKLKDAIPSPWRKLLKTIQIPEETMNFRESLHVNVGKSTKSINLVKNKEIYWTFVNDIRIQSIITNKLERELGIQEDKWKEVFTMPRVVTNTKIRAFQYKLLYNLTPTNSYLKKISKSDTDKCNWCTEIDNTTHYFATCSNLTPFWNSLATWCHGMLEEEINFTVNNVLVGILEKSMKYETLNAILLMAKWHLYKNKLNQSDTFFYRFLCELKYNINLEKSIALKNNKLTEYNNKWQKVENHLT